MNIDNVEFTLDTEGVMSGVYTADVIIEGHSQFDTPLFDSLAADRFASDRGTKMEKHFHIWSEMPCFCVDDEEFNLGDYR